MGSAQLDLAVLEQTLAGREPNPSEGNGRDLKLEVAERLRMHRERRMRGRSPFSEEESRPAGAPHNAIAVAVAERFAQRPSYRAILAEQARLATERAAQEAAKAAADAEIAARNAHAIAEAEHQLIAELELWNVPQAFTQETAEVIHVGGLEPKAGGKRVRQVKREQDAPVPEMVAKGLTVRLYEDLDTPLPVSDRRVAHANVQDREEARALDEEIAFRQAPVFEPFTIEPTTPLPANLLEFPRQLVAARKARPRAAEGPLADETSRNPQLRIFEVEPDQIATAPEAKGVAPEWLSIRLDAQAKTEPVEERPSSAPALLPSMVPPDTAPLSLRVMAEMVDWCVVGLGFVGFVAVVAKVAQKLPTGVPALLAAAGTLGLFYLAYELLFFTLSDQTPGMRYARIGLCTLSDENPTRRAIRRRILAQLVALCPFGLGLLWVLLDDDSLGWHDRISKMYQRAY